MKIVICSKNKAKNNAVNNVLKEFFQDYKLISLETSSQVSETPIGDEEGILGCKNRIEDAKKKQAANLYIAMEGILTKVYDETFLCGWTLIFDVESNEYLYGCSSKIRIPKEIIKNLDKNTRLSTLVANYMNSTDKEISVIGTNGILTNGCYTREAEFTDSILCAISSKYKKLDKNKIL